MDSTTIKPGQVWEMRNGEQITIDAVLNDNGNFPVKSGKWYWQSNGRYWGDGYDHSKDLINLISTP